jgi:Anti-sigma-K factor rskA
MTHSEMNELYELYWLGALEPELSDEIDTHLRENCTYCFDRLSAAALVTAGMSGLAEEQRPPAYLRERVVASVRPRPAINWFYAAAALAAACLVLTAFAVWSANASRSLREQLSALAEERDRLLSTVEVLSRPDTRVVQFGTANAPRGRVFLSRNGGVVFAGSQLPALASDKTFELWLIPLKGAPKPAGLFRANAAGNFVNVLSAPLDLAEIQAVAVSVEPRQGSSAPTTKPILVISTG